MLGFKLWLQVRQLGGGGNDVEVIEGGFVDVDLILFGERPGRQRLLEEIGDAHRDVATREPRQVLGGVGLGIEIHQ
ncbi:hypothetical protein D9M71_456200 [compost metagenome]